MLMVFLNHTTHHFEASAPDLYWLLLSVTRIATPAFLLLSGFVVRHVLITDRAGNAGITLVDRGLFLLLVAHSLTGFDSLLNGSIARWFFDRVMITDAIGIALFFAVLLRHRRAGMLLVQGCTIFILSWLAATFLTFQSSWGQWLAAVTVHWRGSTNPDIDVPIVGYLGAFLIGMALHAHLERPLLKGDSAQLVRRLFLYGSIAASAALLGVLVWHYAKDLVADERTAWTVREFLNPRSKRPPSPAYLAFYGGMSLILLGALFSGKPQALVQPLVRVTSVIGRASLMCFIVQDWVFIVLPRVFGFSGIQSVGFWLAYFGAATVVIYALAELWGRARGNRLLTIGLKALAKERALAGRLGSRGKSLP